MASSSSPSASPHVGAISYFLFLISLCISFGVLELEASHQVYTLDQEADRVMEGDQNEQPYRTSYHFQPPKNWMNDPNGPLVYKGLYHLFYQYNPKGAVWGNIVWAHSTSTDLVNWTPHDHAIYPSQQADINGCWSGSATILPGDKPAMLYTGIDPQKKQVQNLAVPKNLSDPYLVEWVKSPRNPLAAPTTANQINASSFRDPTTAWLGQDGVWRMIVGSKRRRRGLAVLYRSRDFVHWIKAQHPLHSAPLNGMWECPDFFPVSTNGVNGIDTSSLMDSGVRHVLKVSLDDTRHEYYTIGTYDRSRDRYIPSKGSVENDSGLRYDYGKFYASKTFFDSIKNRRILWGWINESSSVEHDIKKGWSGVQAIPRTVWLDKSGKQLIQWPVVELERLRTKRVDLTNKILRKGSVVSISGVTASQADVEVSFSVWRSDLEKAESLDPTWTNPQLICSQKGASVAGQLGPFGLKVLADEQMKEYTAVFFRIFKRRGNNYVVLMCSDQSRSSLDDDNDKTSYGAFVDVDPQHEELSLRTLIDHSIVESFGGMGKSIITARVYPTIAIGEGAKLYAFNYGAQNVTIPRLSAWSMEKAQINQSQR
uniref:Beta-fructofuranosidase n=2 Tax=Kalanchoe fedtschenkoi TaxID=63787 RepID=A0A7N0UZC8_KALFE